MAIHLTYQTVIKLKDGLEPDIISNISNLAEKAFDNRAGKAKNVSNEPQTLLFEGGETLFGCLQLGILNLYKERGVVESLISWQWVDIDDPNESCDVLRDMAIPVN